MNLYLIGFGIYAVVVTVGLILNKRFWDEINRQDKKEQTNEIP